MSETATSSTLGQVLALVGTSPLTSGTFISWIGGGAGESITTADITAVVPAGILNGLAEAAIITAEDAATYLAMELPAFVAALPAEAVLPAVSTLMVFGAANPFSGLAKALGESPFRFRSPIDDLNVDMGFLGAAWSRFQDADNAAEASVRTQLGILTTAGNTVLARLDRQPRMILILARNL
ncbi:flagellin [Kitasatospora sp. NPDC004240]